MLDLKFKLRTKVHGTSCRLFNGISVYGFAIILKTIKLCELNRFTESVHSICEGKSECAAHLFINNTLVKTSYHLLVAADRVRSIILKLPL